MIASKSVPSFCEYGDGDLLLCGAVLVAPPVGDSCLRVLRSPGLDSNRCLSNSNLGPTRSLLLRGSGKPQP